MKSGVKVQATLGAAFVLVAAVAAGACGSDGADGAKGNSCKVVSNADGTVTVSCDDGTNATIKAPAPAPSVTCKVADDGKGTKTITCTDGTTYTVVDGKSGTNGDAGLSAEGGAAGQNGLDLAITTFHGVEALTREMLTVDNKKLVTISGVTATADAAGKVTVKYTVKDANNQPVKGIVGTATSYNIAKLVPPPVNESSTRWVPYIWRTETVSGNSYPNAAGTQAEQPFRENDGTFTDNGDGTYTYVFKTNLAAVTTPVTQTQISYERSRKHRISIMLGGHSGPTGNQTIDFVPDGSTTDTTSRDILNTTSCKSCHGPFFAGHGGDRMTVENCATCHTPGVSAGTATKLSSADAQSGHTLDLKVMVHKIHAGAELASVAGPDGIVLDNPATVADESADNGHYAIYGYLNNKTEWYDVGFPAKVANCEKCHNAPQGATLANVNNWKTNPSRAACGSCHDLTDFESQTPGGNKHGHPGGNYPTDGSCVNCHTSNNFPAWRVETVHDFMNADPRNQSEFIAELAVTLPDGSAPAGGFFTKGQTPMVTLKLKDNEVNGNPYLANHSIYADDGLTAVPPGSGPEGCTVNSNTGACNEARDGKFAGAKLFVHGPRARRVPVLSTMARAVMKSTLPGPFAFARTDALGLKIDSGRDFLEVDGSGGDVVVPGTFNVGAFDTGASGAVSANPAATGTVFYDPAQQAAGTWRDHQYAGWNIIITDNTDTSKPTYTTSVVDNVGAKLTLAASQSILTTPGRVLTYALYAPSGSYSSMGSAAGTSTTLVDNTGRTVAQTWRTDRYKGWTVRITGGTGAGQSATITANDATTLTVGNFATPPDATSTYIIQPWAATGLTPSVTAAEVVNWLNGNATFKERAVAYLDTTWVGSSLAATAAAGATTLALKTGDGAMFPNAGTIVLDRVVNADASGNLTGFSETVAYSSRSTDTLNLSAPLAGAHNKATVWMQLQNVVTIRSRNRGDVFSIQSPSASTNTVVGKVFPAEAVGGYPVHMLGSNSPGVTGTTSTASTVGNNLARQTDPTKNDPAVTWYSDKITYLLDPVDDLQSGTYIANVEITDRGTLIADVNYKAPTVARVSFQVGTATEEKAPANNCGSCHTDPTDTKGYVLDYTRHKKLFNNTAVDLCGACHDYQPQAATGAAWSGAVSISRRVHAVHNGASLKFPNTTVAHSDGEAGRNWDIVMPIDLRTCDVTCHTSTAPFNTTATSGTWKTKPARLPCGGCHDSTGAQAHFKATTWDPTPADPWSGDENESCAACHAKP